MRAAALVLATAAVWSCSTAASAAVFAGHSGWFWGNPVPQGNTLNAVAFAGDRGYAVGEFGTVMRSDDGGGSWSGITTGTTVPLRLVDTISPDGFVVGGDCVVRRSDDAGRSFVTLRWTSLGSACRPKLQSLAFPSSAIGYLLLADGTVLRTRDAGQTWIPRTAIPGTPARNPGSVVHPTDIKFMGPDVGVATTQAGVVYRTTDGGISWSPVAAAPQHLDSISFPDVVTGYAAGGSSVLKTEDGGRTWAQQGVTSPPESISWIRCADALRCVAVTSSGDELLRTSDGGATWASTSPSTQALLAATYSADGTMVAVGEAGATVASADGGFNFATIGGDLPGSFTGLHATSELVAYAFGRAGALARTDDGGQTWSALTRPGASDLVDVAFPSASLGYALDRQGTLMRTSDAGATWYLLGTGTYLKPRAVVAPSISRVVLIGPRGLRWSGMAGLAFRRVRQKLVAKLPLVGGGSTPGLVFAYGPQALVLSVDGGKTWRRAGGLPKRAGRLLKVDFVNDSTAYALTRNRRVWKTIDRGRNWHERAAIGTEVGTDLAFSDARNGYVAVPEFGDDSHGYVLHTSDGGLTWSPQLVDRGRIMPGALDAQGPLAAFAISDLNHLLATETGGDVGQRSTIELSIRRRRPGKPGLLAVRGVLTPARGGETVVVAKREEGGHWRVREVTVSSSGRFTAFPYVTRTTLVVAQWSGDDTRAGAGSRVLTVKVGPKGKNARRRGLKPPAPRPRR